MSEEIAAYLSVPAEMWRDSGTHETVHAALAEACDRIATSSGYMLRGDRTSEVAGYSKFVDGEDGPVQIACPPEEAELVTIVMRSDSEKV